MRLDEGEGEGEDSATVQPRAWRAIQREKEKERARKRERERESEIWRANDSLGRTALLCKVHPIWPSGAVRCTALAQAASSSKQVGIMLIPVYLFLAQWSSNPQPATSDQLPATSYQLPATSNQQPATQAAGWMILARRAELAVLRRAFLKAPAWNSWVASSLVYFG